MVSCILCRNILWKHVSSYVYYTWILNLKLLIWTSDANWRNFCATFKDWRIIKSSVLQSNDLKSNQQRTCRGDEARNWQTFLTIIVIAIDRINFNWLRYEFLCISTAREHYQANVLNQWCATRLVLKFPS